MQKKRTKTTSRKKAAENKKTATAKRGSSGSANEPVQDHTKRNYELRGLAFVAAGLIAICGIAGLNVGFVGLKAAKFLQYFFGIGALVAAGAFVGAGGYYIMRHQKLVFNARLLGSTGFFACAISLYHHLVVKPGEEILPSSLVEGGGLLGGAITIFLHNVAGVDGTPILLAVGLIGTLIVATTWSLAQGILTTKEKAEKGADVAKKATVVVYDKTVEVGGKAKEQVQEYVQEHIDDVGERLKRLRGKQFLARYEQDSAFLNGEQGASAAGSGKRGAASYQEKAHASGRDSLSGVSITAEMLAEKESGEAKEFAPPPANADELVEANPVAAGFFAEKFSSTAEPEEVPELAVQLGLETAAKSQGGQHIPHIQRTQADDWEGMADFDWERYAADNSDSIFADIGSDIDTDMHTGIDAETEVNTDTDVDVDAGVEAEAETETAPEADEYDYGIDDMEITYPEEPVDLTEAVEDDGPVQQPGEEFITEQMAGQAGVEQIAAKAAPEQAAPPPPPYKLPPLHLLSKTVKTMNESLNQEISNNAKILGETLANFKVKASILNACHGPAVTRYEVKPAPGVKVSKITGLADDIALNMAATAVRIEQIPGKAAIGIEVPNRELESVQLREVLENPAFAAAKSKLTVGLGKDIGGQAIFADLAKMPHLLVAGATGSGKSVCINTLITSVLFKAKPTEVKFILIDPKMVELSVYNDIPHLMVPVVTDAKKAASVLNWAVQEMEKRYGLIAQVGVRNMEGYNRLFADEPEKQLPSIVIIIDELADLMMVAPHDVEDAICRIAQKARAAGIYLVLATQRPSVNVITGVIKANIPSRISFAVTSQIDSRTILDASGAEKLLGKGDMLFKPQEANKPTRIQGAFVSDKEVEMLTEYIRSQGHKLEANQEIIDFTNKAAESENAGDGDDKPQAGRVKIDSLLRDAVELTMSSGSASASSFQRRYHIGYSRAGRLLDTMEQLGIVGPPQGSKPREILVTEAQAFEIMDNYENQ
ncbi:DNA translocase FtsK [Anaerovibrio sp.]|uniref:DNA translocase FtsK n=1 Tax=Anaerovibrio sp. TaxID=1872532 RepID=UPI00262EF6FE|nr:DNA translocase FtsK [Anaerovibrio sp.]MDD6597950.1 DNA translocase FtsK [Anaerovibrio sp.]